METYLYQDLYDLEETHWWHKAKRQAVLSLLKQHVTLPQPKILDIGCGAGKNIEALNEIGPTSGIDLSKNAITFCKKRGLKNVLQADAYDIPYKAATFDVITLLDVLEHTDDKKSLAEIYRVLKPGGLLIITVPAFTWLWSHWDVVLHHKRRYTKYTLAKVLTASRFNVRQQAYLYSFLVLPIFVIRKIKSWFFKTNNYGSDFSLNTGITNTLLFLASRLELKLLRFGGLPVGTSIICVAQKAYE